MTKLAPAWLALSEDRTTFNVLSERVEVVKKIFCLAIEGMGCRLIAKKFNVEHVPIFPYRKNSKVWHPSYIKKILKSKAVLGQYQPCVGKHGPDRHPVGDVISGYYPAVIDEATFYKAQQALKSRGNGRATGRTGANVANLFAKRMRHAIDGSTMTLVNNSCTSCQMLVSSAAQRGKSEDKYLSFPYEIFEYEFLSFCNELEPKDFLSKEETKNDDLIEAEKELSQTEQMLATLKRRIAGAKDVGTGFATLLDLATDAERKRNKLRTRVDDLKTKAAESKPSELLSELQDISYTGLNNQQTRVKLRTIIQGLVEQIYILIIEPIAAGGMQVCKAQVHFKSGRITTLFCDSNESRCIRHDWGFPFCIKICDLRTEPHPIRMSKDEYNELCTDENRKKIDELEAQKSQESEESQ